MSRSLIKLKHLLRTFPTSVLLLIIIRIGIGLFIFVNLLYFILLKSSKKSIQLGKNNLNFEERMEDKLIFSESDNTLTPTDQLILSYIRKYHLHHKSPSEQINLTNPGNIHPLDLYVALALKKVMKGRENGKRNGFFVECGANDGEFLSNTIALEMRLNWTGLLIEGSPSLAKKLISKRRNAWVSDMCLSGSRPEQIEFLTHKNSHPWSIGNGKINPIGKYGKPKDREGFKEEFYISEGIINCFPLYSILTAINVTTVDFFSLDVEGHEYKILEAIPFDLVDIKIILVEHFLAPEGSHAIASLLMMNNYALFLNSSTDYIFIKRH